MCFSSKVQEKIYARFKTTDLKSIEQLEELYEWSM